MITILCENARTLLCTDTRTILHANTRAVLCASKKVLRANARSVSSADVTPLSCAKRDSDIVLRQYVQNVTMFHKKHRFFYDFHTQCDIFTYSRRLDSKLVAHCFDKILCKLSYLFNYTKVISVYLQGGYGGDYMLVITDKDKAICTSIKTCLVCSCFDCRLIDITQLVLSTRCT